MPTVVLDPVPREITQLVERRRALDQDRLDEVWEGVLHMVPAPSFEHAAIAARLKALMAPLAGAAGLIVTDEFNLGDSEQDFRVPDGGLHRPGASGVWQATAALVMEVLSPDDEAWQKLPFYAAHHVDEVLIVDPQEKAVHWLALSEGGYRPLDRSALIDLGPVDLASQLDFR
jgi:Uma2 family endonuclease